MQNPLGATSAGTAWALKALHPADPLTEVEGIPDESTNTSACLNWQQQSLVVSPDPADPTWDCEILFMADPSKFCVFKTTSSGGAVAYTVMHNSAMGVSCKQAIVALQNDFEHWRVAYAGLTLHLTAPATASQGTITAAQYPLRGQFLGCASNAAGTISYLPFYRYISTEAEPTYADLIKMPNAYTGLAKDGLYMPLKLESNHIQWHDQSDRVWDATGWAVAGTNLTVPAADLGTYPWPSLQLPVWNNAGVWTGDMTLRLCNDIVGGIYVRGIDKAASITLTLREGFEVRTVPGSPFTSFLHVSPEHDLMAVSNYYKIARQLKDAYPVEYNDLGKLWDLIKGAARVISPVLGLVPGGNLIKAAGGVFGKLGDTLAAPKGGKDVISAAQMEAARKAVAGAMSRRASGQPRPGKGKGKKKSGKVAAAKAAVAQL